MAFLTTFQLQYFLSPCVVWDACVFDMYIWVLLCVRALATVHG